MRIIFLFLITGMMVNAMEKNKEIINRLDQGELLTDEDWDTILDRKPVPSLKNLAYDKLLKLSKDEKKFISQLSDYVKEGLLQSAQERYRKDKNEKLYNQMVIEFELPDENIQKNLVTKFRSFQDMKGKRKAGRVGQHVQFLNFLSTMPPDKQSIIWDKVK